MKFDEASVVGHDVVESPTAAEQAFEGHPGSSLHTAIPDEATRR